MEHNCNYNKIKLLHQISHMIWVIEHTYIKDAKKGKHPACATMYKEIAVALKQEKKKLLAAVEGLAKEGKFK